MKKLSEKQIKAKEEQYREVVLGNSYNSAIYARDASDKQVWLVNKLLRENGYMMMTGTIRQGEAQALIWWLEGEK